MKVGKAVPLPTAPLCPAHQIPLVMFCPSCRGGAGQERGMTPARQAHIDRIAGLGPAARWGTKGRKSASGRGKSKKNATP